MATDGQQGGGALKHFFYFIVSGNVIVPLSLNPLDLQIVIGLDVLNILDPRIMVSTARHIDEPSIAEQGAELHFVPVPLVVMPHAAKPWPPHANIAEVHANVSADFVEVSSIVGGQIVAPHLSAVWGPQPQYATRSQDAERLGGQSDRIFVNEMLPDFASVHGGAGAIGKRPAFGYVADFYLGAELSRWQDAAADEQRIEPGEFRRQPGSVAVVDVDPAGGLNGSAPDVELHSQLA